MPWHASRVGNVAVDEYRVTFFGLKSSYHQPGLFAASTFSLQNNILEASIYSAVGVAVVALTNCVLPVGLLKPGTIGWHADLTSTMVVFRTRA